MRFNQPELIDTVRLAVIDAVRSAADDEVGSIGGVLWIGLAAVDAVDWMAGWLWNG